MKTPKEFCIYPYLQSWSNVQLLIIVKLFCCQQYHLWKSSKNPNLISIGKKNSEGGANHIFNDLHWEEGARSDHHQVGNQLIQGVVDNKKYF